MTDSDPITRLNAALQGRYRIESELGEGMATVDLACWKPTPQFGSFAEESEEERD